MTPPPDRCSYCGQIMPHELKRTHEPHEPVDISYGSYVYLPVVDGKVLQGVSTHPFEAVLRDHAERYDDTT